MFTNSPFNLKVNLSVDRALSFDIVRCEEQIHVCKPDQMELVMILASADSIPNTLVSHREHQIMSNSGSCPFESLWDD